MQYDDPFLKGNLTGAELQKIDPSLQAIDRDLLFPIPSGWNVFLKQPSALKVEEQQLGIFSHAGREQNRKCSGVGVGKHLDICCMALPNAHADARIVLHLPQDPVVGVELDEGDFFFKGKGEILGLGVVEDGDFGKVSRYNPTKRTKQQDEGFLRSILPSAP